MKNRHPLRNKEIQEIAEYLQHTFGEQFFSDEDKIEVADVGENKILLINDEADFVVKNDHVFFTIPGLLKHKPGSQRVVVDMGAVRFVVNGADIMSPGIVAADENIEEGDQVWICDEQHHKPLAVGIALCNGSSMVEENKGKAIQNIHFVGDELWKNIS